MPCACETVCACQRTRAVQGDGDNKTKREATKPDFDSGWCVAMKNPVPGFLSGMGFLLTRTIRKRQRWRDGEGAFGSCLRRDVAAINKMHFCY
jgi:hypothetical protein